MNVKRNPTLTIALTHTLSLTLIDNSYPYAYTYRMLFSVFAFVLLFSAK